MTLIKRDKLLICLYEPGDIFWLVRANVVFFQDIGVVEITLGVLGFGLMIQFGTRTRF